MKIEVDTKQIAIIQELLKPYVDLLQSVSIQASNQLTKKVEKTGDTDEWQTTKK